MKIDELNIVKTQIQRFNELEIEKLIAEAYPNQIDLEKMQIANFNVGEFVTFSKRIIKQLSNELETENRLILPFTFTTSEQGQSSLLLMMTNLVSHITNKQFPNAETALLWLASYQLQNGFFDKSNSRVHSIDALELKGANDNLKIISENYKQLKSEYTILLADLTEQKRLSIEFLTLKQTELQQISHNFEGTNKTNSEVQKLLISATQSETKITTSLEQIEKEKKRAGETADAMSVVLALHKKDFDGLLNKLNLTEEKYQSLYTDFEAKHSFVEKKHKYFEDRNTYLDNLIGREVGASLFETFKQRKVELTEPLKWWRYAIAIMGSLTFIIIFAIFTNFFGLFGSIEIALKWEVIIVNILKSSPFFFLLYYCIAQYNKERNFQEEYAFKSAAALTIKAYADILKNEESKDALVLTAVANIYKSPIYNNHKSTKEVNSALDMISNFVNKGTEIISKK